MKKRTLKENQIIVSLIVQKCEEYNRSKHNEYQTKREVLTKRLYNDKNIVNLYNRYLAIYDEIDKLNDDYNELISFSYYKNIISQSSKPVEIRQIFQEFINKQIYEKLSRNLNLISINIHEIESMVYFETTEEGRTLANKIFSTLLKRIK